MRFGMYHISKVAFSFSVLITVDYVHRYTRVLKARFWIFSLRALVHNYTKYHMLACCPRPVRFNHSLIHSLDLRGA